MPAIDINKIKEVVYDKLPVQLRSLFNSAPGRELLKHINATLMVFNNRLYNMSNGDWQELEQPEADQNATVSPLEIAKAANTLLTDHTTPSILLLLPSNEFVSTTVSMPGVAKENVKSALKLQAGTLLPGLDENLLLTVNPVTVTGDSSSSSRGDVALWFPERRAEEFFDAFKEKGLFLAALMPRVLGPTSNAKEGVFVQESDEFTVTAVQYHGGAIQGWLQINKPDLQQEMFSTQWQESIDGWDVEGYTRHSIQDPDDYSFLIDCVAANKEYSFFPRGAELAKRQVEKGKRLIFAGITVAVLLGIGAIPFGLQSVEASRLKSSMERQLTFSKGPREDRQVVIDFEDQWGAISELPKLYIGSTLLTIDNVIGDVSLTSIEIENGFISIEGTSSDPESLIQKLEQDPMFTAVDFARATNNSRFYIDLRLSSIDYESYMQRYFAE